jgi:hypothetical protein
MPRIHDEAKGRTKERSDAGSADSEVALIYISSAFKNEQKSTCKSPSEKGSKTTP